MNQQLAAKLLTANKCIFVKQYDKASRILDELVASEEGRKNLLIHLRRVELGAKLDQLETLRAEYEEISIKEPGELLGHVGLLFVEQHFEGASGEEILQRYQMLLNQFGEHPALYYGIGFALEGMGNQERAIFNYEQSGKIDAEWYPSFFGLSQIYYQKGDSKNGDYYFYLFESAAPFNVYGNFETHRSLSQDFLEHEKFEEAETAITTLAQWWVDNKGSCPPEIQVFENLSLSRIKSIKGDETAANTFRTRGKDLAEHVLLRADIPEGVLYFIAKILEEHGCLEVAVRYYKHILRTAGTKPQIVQKIGGQFLALGEFELARDLFSDALDSHPDNPEIRFCYLVTKLKLANVNVEDYLIGKERLKQLVASDSDKVEILALLHNLLAKFKDDAEVHQQMAETYLRLGNGERAGKHYETMYTLDPKSTQTSLKYATYLIQHKDGVGAGEILDRVHKRPGLAREHEMEISWLRSVDASRRNDFAKAKDYLAPILKADPWNVSYLVQDVYSTMQLQMGDEGPIVDSVINNLLKFNEKDLDWERFDAVTAQLEERHLYELVYGRSKLRFIYTDGDENQLKKLADICVKYNAQVAANEFLRLLNTNFDSPMICWVLGLMAKELWQLEIASMWFEYVVNDQRSPDSLKAKTYLELADCGIWLDKNINRAIEYAKIAIDMKHEDPIRSSNVLAHAYLKAGMIKQAKSFLTRNEEDVGPETKFLNGLLEYRNGAHQKANAIWKPLLTFKSESNRMHHIKQEILRFYFDGAPYLKVN